MAQNPQPKSKAEKLYEKLAAQTKYSSISERDARQLLSHPLISADSVERNSGGSHQWIVTVSDPLIVALWGHSMFNVVVHDREVKKVYVDDIIKYIGFKYQIIEMVRREAEENGLKH